MDNEAYNETIYQLREVIKGITDNGRRLKAEKHLSAFEVVAGVAKSIASISKEYVSSKKRAFKRKERRPMKKRKNALTTSKIISNIISAKCQLEVIASAPIPKYREGTFKSGGFILCDHEKELVTHAKLFIYPCSKINTLPI